MKKNKFLIFIILGILAIAGIFTYIIFTKQDEKTTLTIIEKQWIESNKNKRFDFSIVSNVPIFSYNGNGVFLDFLDDLEKVTGLEFNRISSAYGKESNSAYGFKVVDQVGENDILVYEDNYVLVSNYDVRFEDLNQIQGVKAGVLNTDVTLIDYYLKGANISYKVYDSPDKLFNSIKNDPDNGILPEVDALIIPKTIYLDYILDSEFFINYNITELSKKYVLTLGSDDKLNTILSKYFNKWQFDKFDKVFNERLFDLYYKKTNVEEKSKVQFRSKKYNYGYVENSPFDMTEMGINYSIINKFSKISDIEINFQKYSSYADMIKAFNENNIDFMFNNFSNLDYNMDVYNTISIYDEKVVVLGTKKNNDIVNSVNSLNGKSVNVIEGSMLQTYLQTQNFVVNGFKTVESLKNNSKKDDLIVIDYYTYLYYSNSLFTDYNVKYIFNLDKDYTFIFRDISDNKLLMNSFNFYLAFMNEKKVLETNYNNLLTINVEKKENYLLIISIVLVVVIILSLLLLIRSKKLNKRIKKDDKIKYIDILTSLKNRNYLNDNIEKWDSSEVYPQAIIIADLNNLKYINDNYGHNEGDKLIKEAANILIKNQISNSEIIRSSGNEFLIYLVGYDEKQIVSYIKKLTKEFKELAHGFGVAIGYSMINDAIKTTDDAINEATLDMRANKQEANN